MDTNPVWPVVALAAVTAIDGVACIGPVSYIRQALDRIDCPPRIRRLLPPVKFASALGLVVGIWVPVLGLVTSAAMVVYFVIAITVHVRARDTVANTAGAVLMLAAVVATATCFT